MQLQQLKIVNQITYPSGHTTQKSHYDVKATSFWRHNDVIIAPFVRWDPNDIHQLKDNQETHSSKTIFKEMVDPTPFKLHRADTRLVFGWWTLRAAPKRQLPPSGTPVSAVTADYLSPPGHHTTTRRVVTIGSHTRKIGM